MSSLIDIKKMQKLGEEVTDIFVREKLTFAEVSALLANLTTLNILKTLNHAHGDDKYQNLN